MHLSESMQYAEFVVFMDDVLKDQAGFALNERANAWATFFKNTGDIQFNTFLGLQIEVSKPVPHSSSELLLKADLFKVASVESSVASLTTIFEALLHLNGRQYPARAAYSAERSTLSLFQNIRLGMLSSDAVARDVCLFLDAVSETVVYLRNFEISTCARGASIKFLAPANFSFSTEARYKSHHENEKTLDLSDWVITNTDQQEAGVESSTFTRRTDY